MFPLQALERRIRELKDAIGSPPGSAKGAVSLVLRGRSSMEVLVIERAEREGDPWSGQLAFPGGRRKKGDRTPLDTARRETKEEVGLTLARNARLLGWLPARAPANRVEWIVVPFVFSLTRPAKITAGAETARAFWVPLDAMPGTMYRAVIPLPMGDLETPAFDVGGKPLWGFSFRVLLDLFDLVGWPGEGVRKPAAAELKGIPTRRRTDARAPPTRPRSVGPP